MGAKLVAIGILVAATFLGSGSAEAACGALNQTPCKLWERIPSCDKGLVENFALGKCVRPASAKPAPAPAPTEDQRNREIMAAMTGHANLLKPVHACLAVSSRKARFVDALKARNAPLGVAIVKECASASTLAALAQAPAVVLKYRKPSSAPRAAGCAVPLKTWTIGFMGPGVQAVVGAGIEVGLAVPLGGCGNVARIYETHSWKLGPGVGAGVDILPMGLSFEAVESGYTESRGRTIAVIPGGGPAFGIWWNKAATGWAEYESFSLAFGVGGSLDFGSMNYAGTNTFQ